MYPVVPSITKDGDKWCAMFGANLQEGIAGFGDSPAEAYEEFMQEWGQKDTITGLDPNLGRIETATTRGIYEKPIRKYKMWNEKCKCDSNYEASQNIYLRLTDDEDSVSLVVCDKFGTVGKRGFIFSINKSSGECCRESGLNESYGFQLEENGKIKEIDEF